MNPRDLIKIARQLASGAVDGNRGRPRQAELRRAVSAAYYALFHAPSPLLRQPVGRLNPNRRGLDTKPTGHWNTATPEISAMTSLQ